MWAARNWAKLLSNEGQSKEFVQTVPRMQAGSLNWKNQSQMLATHDGHLCKAQAIDNDLYILI